MRRVQGTHCGEGGAATAYLAGVLALTGLCAVVALLLAPCPGQAQTGDEARPGLPAPSTVNPFGDFETHYLSNGLKVWFKRFEGAPQVSVNVGVPYGSDLDPPGKQQLAHFTEHMLFSDHEGRTEGEIKDEIEGLGGIRNGVTSPDRTFYYVTIAREHGLFAIEWLSRIMSPHAMDPELVDRGRQPVAVEIGAGPRDTTSREPRFRRIRGGSPSRDRGAACSQPDGSIAQ